MTSSMNAKRAANALCSLFVGAVASIPAPAVATPTQYEIAFSASAVTPAGSFFYDPEVPAFSNFTVAWDGVTFDLTASANSPVFNPGSILQEPLCGTATGAALTFAVLTHSGCSPTPAMNWEVDALTTSSAIFAFDWPTGSGGGNFFIASTAVTYVNQCFSTCSRGDFSVTAVVPEPATAVLLGVGLAAIGWSRRRGSDARAA